jgi:uncharacterized damage-inducible protein DinB
MAEELSRFFRYELWANRRVLESLQQSAPPAKAVELFAHVLAAQEVWLARLHGQDTSALAVWPDISLGDCQTALKRLETSVQTYVESLNEDILETRIAYRTQRGDRFENTPREILTHLAFHSHYHRGQIAARLRDAGLTPVNTDFIQYVRAEPEPRP